MYRVDAIRVTGHHRIRNFYESVVFVALKSIVGKYIVSNSGGVGGDALILVDSAIALACAVLETEAQAIMALQARIDNHFVEACQYLLNCKGRTVVIGMGKSGHI